MSARKTLAVKYDPNPTNVAIQNLTLEFEGMISNGL